MKTRSLGKFKSFILDEIGGLLVVSFDRFIALEDARVNNCECFWSSGSDFNWTNKLYILFLIIKRS